MPSSLDILKREVIACERCERLRSYCEGIAATKRRAYLGEDYWGRPVPGFGDPNARVFLIGLAPGAHGANRTGRVFTGDKSGEWLYRALFETGFASAPQSLRAGDGLELYGCYISCSVKCAPPDNKPLPGEILNCRPYLIRELQLLRKVEVVVALGRLAFDNYLDVLKNEGLVASRSGFSFSHNGVQRIDGAPALVSSFHPSQQNTSTGKLTREMLADVFLTVRQLLDANSASRSRQPMPRRRSSR